MPAALRRIPWLLVFLALLWLGATFAYLGDTGKHSDDYWATSRLIEREGIDWSVTPWQQFPYFWRPLHLIHVWIINTVFWHRDWVAHLELALVHGAVCFMLFRLLVGLGSARGPAIAGAILFGTCPLLGEAIGWSSASCNAIGSLLMLITLDAGRRFGAALSGHEPDAAFPPRRRLGRLVAIALLGFATACFYEPAAAGLAAMPLVVLAALPRAAAFRDRLRRTILATTAAAIPCALYVILLLSTAPPGQRGTARTVGDLQPLPENVNKLARALRHVLAGSRGRDVVLGSMEQGLAAARDHPAVLGLIIATAIAGVLVLITRTRTKAHGTVGPQAHIPTARGHLLLIGVALLVVPWAPFIAQHARNFELRSLYAPLLGVAFIVAAVGNGFYRWRATLADRSREASGLIATIAVGLLGIAGQVGLIGMQTQFRINARQDELVASQLAAMSSHLQPGTVILILAAQHRGAGTSRPSYNALLHTALEAPWCAAPFLHRSMHRHDVRLISGTFWARGVLPIDHLTRAEMCETRPGIQNRIVSWENIVPLWIDSHAQVHIVQSLIIEPLNGSSWAIHPPRAQCLALVMSPSSVVSPTCDSDCVHLRDTSRGVSRVTWGGTK